MAAERTLSIVKPDAVAKNVIGKIYSRFESNGLRIVAAQMRRLSRAGAEGFYAVHRERPFFRDLVDFMTSGPVMIQVLEGENAIAKNRDLMGATDPKKAAAGTIRADFAASIDANAVHGSDGPDTAKVEVTLYDNNGHPALTPIDSDGMRAAAAAIKKVYKKAPYYTREGGSIPVVADFQHLLGVEAVLLGFGLPDDNLHAPNEKFDLVQFENGLATVAYFFSEYAAIKS